MNMKIINRIINILEGIVEQLEIMNSNNGKCKHDLEELEYYYDDDWRHKGSIAWDKQGKEKTLYHCKKCGQVFVKDRNI